MSEVMRRIKEYLATFVGVLLLVLAAYAGGQTEGAGGPAAAPAVESVTSAHMRDFNQGLQPAATDDDFRTTYEVFVYSFCDSDGDGVGDINGVRQKLDYIAELGFDQIWLTPVHPSATYHKYDVDDYCAIDPAFGTMEDYEALLEECHARGIRVLLDLVLNHTSDTHAWFRAAADYLRELPDGEDPVFEDCPYVWYYTFSREPYDGFVPLEGTSWFYEARFWSEMPDLNLGNEVVREEVRDIVRFWLGKGVDGFRLDAVTYYVTGSTEGTSEFLRYLIDACTEADPDCYLVGEAWTDRASIAALYASGIDSLFDFPFVGPDGAIARAMKGNLSAADLVRAMVDEEEAFARANPAAVNAPFYTNHDTDRSASYYADDQGPVTKMAYALSLLMPGDSFVYCGEELGMMGSGKDENKRLPLYWSADPKAPGMCVGPPDMDEVAMRFGPLEEQVDNDLSLWRWFGEVIRVRRAFPAIARGKTELVDGVSDEAVAALIRRHTGVDDVMLVMNLRDQTVQKDLSAVGANLGLAAVLNTGEEGISYEGGTLTLPAYSIAVLTLGAAQ